MLSSAVILMSLMMAGKSISLVLAKSDYRSSVQYLLDKDPKAKFLSTQNYVQNLYTKNARDVLPCPRKFPTLINLRAKGYKYLIIEPQAYISWTESQKRFDPPLIGYLEFLINRVKPKKTFDHYNEALLERFIFEHSANLRTSIAFIKEAKQRNLGALRVYDVSQTINYVLPWLSKKDAWNQ